MKFAEKILSYILVAALASAFTLAVTEEEVPESKLGELSALIQERFIEDVDVTAMEDSAAGAMIASLGDRWSHYISAADYVAYQEQMNNAYVGVGITIQAREDGYLDILEVSGNGPAEQAGMLAGDVLKQVDGQDCAQLGMDGTRNLVRGKENTTVALTVDRGGETLTFQVVRAYFQTTVAWGQMLPSGYGYVRIENFDSRCASETIAAIEELVEQGAKGILFDVRNNPGGYKRELVEVLDYLLPEGVLFRSEYYDGRTGEDKSDARCLEMPMAVLVNGESYSAAEFFAAALGEYEAAIVVGEKTCGKGYFQETYELSDGSAVGLSVGKYYTPKGVSLAGVGITPEVEAAVDEETFWQIYYGQLAPEEDPQVHAAENALQNGN